MKLLAALPLLGLTTAFVIPDEAMLEQLNQLPVTSKSGQQATETFNKFKAELANELKHGYGTASSIVENTFDKVYGDFLAAGGDADPYYGDWWGVNEEMPELVDVDRGHRGADGPAYRGPGGGGGGGGPPDDGMPHRPDEPHHGGPPGAPGDHPRPPPPRGPDHPHRPDEPPRGPDHPKRPDEPHGPDHPTHPKPPPHHKKPKHGDPHHGHGKPNLTIYQMINESKYTTKFAELINKHEDIVHLLNSTDSSHNFTVFAPTDDAFKHIPEHGGKPSDDLLRKVILYHIIKDEYPARRVLGSDTIPTALDELELGGAGGRPQRLRISLGFRGLTLNFYAHINAGNIPATNGYIHGLTAILVPPPSALKVLSIMPSEFSTLELALLKTGLDKELASLPHKGLTLFAPDNRAWAKLPRLVNAFLFSEKGQKYLKMLLQYHVVANQTLYSDEYYPHIDDMTGESDKHHRDMRPIHLDLETLLEGKSLSVDVANFYGFRNIRINGYNDVYVRDGVAKDGVLHVPGHIVVPPKKAGEGEEVFEVGEEETVEEFKSRFDGVGERKKTGGWWEEFEL